MMKANDANKMTKRNIEKAERVRWEVVEKYGNEIIEPEILKAIEKNQYETTVEVDEEINMNDLIIVVTAAGYRIEEEEGFLTISWKK